MTKLLLVFLCLSFPAAALTITVKTGEGGNYFVPDRFTIDPGDTVRWVWVSGHHNTSGVSTPKGAADWYGDVNSSSTEFIYIAGTSGLYTYTCTHHSGMDGQFFVRGCSFPDQPVITATPGGTVCAGDTIWLHTAPQPGADYQWMRGPVAIAGAMADSLPVTGPGIYKVLVNKCGVDSVSAPFTVTIHPKPVPAFTYSATGLGFLFTNTTPGMTGMQFRWRFSDGSPDQHSLHAIHSFAAAGTYTVKLDATDTATGCTDSASASLEAALNTLEYLNPGMTISPNPATSVIDIQGAPAAGIRFSDLYGRTMITANTDNDGIYRADVRTWLPGIYLLHMTTVDGTRTIRVQILH